MGIQFGSFDGVCQQAALVICPLMGSSQGIEPTCYSRNVQIGHTIIFQPGTLRGTFKLRLLRSVFCRFNMEYPRLGLLLTCFLTWALDLLRLIRVASPAACFIHIVAIIMTIIMILHIRSKYTAVGSLHPWQLDCEPHQIR